MQKKPRILAATLDGILKSKPELREQVYSEIDHYVEEYKKMEAMHGPVKTAQAFNHLLQKSINEDMSPTTKISCSKGCSYCCRTVEVCITDHEAQVLVEHVKAICLPVDMDVLKSQAEPKDYKDVPNPDKKCVFLSQEGVCQVYSHRPSPCRKYHVTSPPEDCDAIARPKAEVRKVGILFAEILATAMLNAVPSGRMSAMLLKYLNPINQDTNA